MSLEVGGLTKPHSADNIIRPKKVTKNERTQEFKEFTIITFNKKQIFLVTK